MKKVRIRAAGLAAALAAVLGFGTSGPALALGVEDYVGSVSLTAAGFCPQGTMEAAGQTLPIMRFQALYALITTKYGGDGQSTFNLPDMRGKAPADGMLWCIVTDGIFPTRE